MNEDVKGGIALTTIGLLALAGFSTLFLWGCPKYNVWTKEMAGRAELAQAESNRQIATLEAKAKMESAKMLAEAEVIRAGGVAEANRIIGESLKENESYLWYLWINELDAAQMQVIYVPTEANLPILEAGKRPGVPSRESKP